LIDPRIFKDNRGMITRIPLLAAIDRAFDVHPVVALMGPRQVGKTTLAAQFSERIGGKVAHFDLESPTDRRRLSLPETVLAEPTALTVIDEIQHDPRFFEILRVVVDRTERRQRFLILGSASPDLVRGATESLAGRVGFVDVPGLSLAETGMEAIPRLWLRGGFPNAFLGKTDAASMTWREAFVRTFLERDLPALGLHVPSERLRRFWTMLAYHHGGVWNGAVLARSLGTGESAARHYLDILAGAYMLRVLPPWFENTGKRQLKSPKVYLRDSGLLHTLLGLPGRDALLGHPQCGLSWEGFALEQILTACPGAQAYFWGTHAGAELDLLLMKEGKRYGFEFKLSEAPGTTKSMHSAMETLKLERLCVIHPGKNTYPLAENIAACPLDQPETWKIPGAPA
jgi:predicted AAA+ superfamily ATPase